MLLFARRFSNLLSVRRYATSVSDLYRGLINGDRGCLARSITLVESTQHEKQQHAKELLAQVLRSLKEKQDRQLDKPISFRIGSFAFD